jgi:predicted nucleic acid-binding protein
VKFWDASALVPLCITQPASAAVAALLNEDRDIVAWWASPVECASAFARLRRSGVLDFHDESHAAARLDELLAQWVEVTASEAVRREAMRLLRMHPLSAADALQLAAAVVARDGWEPAAVVTLDDRLAAAARLEGFRVEP